MSALPVVNYCRAASALENMYMPAPMSRYFCIRILTQYSASGYTKKRNTLRYCALHSKGHAGIRVSCMY